MVKWCQYSGEVDYQYTVNCIFLFKCCLQKMLNIRSNLLKLLDARRVYMHGGKTTDRPGLVCMLFEIASKSKQCGCWLQDSSEESFK